MSDLTPQARADLIKRIDAISVRLCGTLSPSIQDELVSELRQLAKILDSDKSPEP